MSDPLDETLALAAEMLLDAECPFNSYFPEAGPIARSKYAKHMAFFRAGRLFMQRLFMAANRVGKSEAGAYEMTCHLTGRYPDWWEGRRFDHPIEAWAAGTSGETTRDIVQAKLLGRVNPETGELMNAGMIPSHLVKGTTRRPHALPGAVETVFVQHVSGGVSVLGLKSYEQGRKSWEGTAKHVIWCDEEPPEDVYVEAIFRLATTDGLMLVTFTPLQGMSAVVRGFLKPDQEAAKKVKHVTMAGWDDVPHLSDKTKAALLATTPPFQRDARTKGLPQLGAGAIYQFPLSEILVKPFPIPASWRRAFGADMGGGRKHTAACWGAIDPSSRIVYIYSDYKRESPEIPVHVAAFKARGDWIPGVGDAAALVTTADDAEQIVRAYQRAGVDIVLPNKAVETGIQTVWELFTNGLLKVFNTCGHWIEEFEGYHRDEKGRIVKEHDHVMDAFRYLVISGLARAKAEPSGKKTWTPNRRSGNGAQAWMR